MKKRDMYGINNFRGLDTQNKPLKVANFRATSGKNFIIDSDTLKTRPAIIYKNTPIKDLEKDDSIIDLYNYRGVELVFTEKRIYINGKYSATNIKTNLSLLFNFKGKRPIFQEENNCLFIFGLGAIYVFSIIYSGGEILDYVLYELSSKPTNPYDQSDENLKDQVKDFDELPIPYEPTIFIDNNRLDDINLLSRVTKYKLFGHSDGNNQESINTILLPTTYDPEKHGTAEKEISFYKDVFGDINAIPLYKGIVGDMFIFGKRSDGSDKTIADYGEIINEDDPVVISNNFYPAKDFEATILSKEGQDDVVEVISEEINLTAKMFFDMTTKDQGQNIFQYLLDYLKLDDYQGDNNRLIAFRLNIIANVRYKDKETDKLIKIEKVEYQKIVYVQLYEYETSEISFSEPEYKGSFVQRGSSSNHIDRYPAYPFIAPSNIPEGDPDYHTFYLTGNTTEDFKPIKKDGFNIDDFKNLVTTAIIKEKSNPLFKEDDVVIMNARYYNERNVISYADIRNYYEDRPESWGHNYSTVVNDGDEKNLSKYPEKVVIANPSDAPVIDFGTLTSDIIIFTDGNEYDAGFTSYGYLEIEKALKRMLNERLLRGLGTSHSYKKGVCYFKVARRFRHTDSESKFRLYSFTTIYEYKTYSESTYYDQQSFSSRFKISLDSTDYVIDSLYEINFVQDKNAFELKMKNYFYDFNNEPSIDVKITFENNPDYRLITDSTFGTNFGSENRLFLAGNKEFPNIDRFNVSNDLLGGNKKNQSYESSYFPSKNYRVLGGKGAINSYVTATDTQLYITKESYPNDQKFFVRERMLDENGVVGYKEYKTSIDKTSINNNTIVRFNNDMLMLDKTGLYGVEIASNVLTNERLLKLRSSFINDDLRRDIESYDNDKIFIYEDNKYLYIFIGKKVYVADSRYLAMDENGIVDNFNYEIVKWEIPFEFKNVRLIDGVLTLIDSDGINTYIFKDNENSDNQNLLYEEGIYLVGINGVHQKFVSESNTTRMLKEEDVEFLKSVVHIPKNNFYLKIADNNTGFIIEDDKFVIINNTFDRVEDGDILSFTDANGTTEHMIYGLESSGRTSFKVDGISDISKITLISFNLKDKRLYIKHQIIDGSKVYHSITPYKPDEVTIIKRTDIGAGFENYLNDLLKSDTDVWTYGIELDFTSLLETRIELEWTSAILDFGNNIYEKTLFKTMIYATKQNQENTLFFGYKTMRKLQRLDEFKKQDLSNPFNFDNVNFNSYAISTFSEFGASIPTKENNFLYIQLRIYGKGNIELNGMQFLYKNNRMLKTIG